VTPAAPPTHEVVSDVTEPPLVVGNGCTPEQDKSLRQLVHGQEFTWYRKAGCKVQTRVGDDIMYECLALGDSFDPTVLEGATVDIDCYEFDFGGGNRQVRFSAPGTHRAVLMNQGWEDCSEGTATQIWSVPACS